MYNPEHITSFDSRFRELLKQAELSRDMYLKLQKERPNIHGLEDRDRIIDNLERRIMELQSENNSYKTQSTVSVNVIGNT